LTIDYYKQYEPLFGSWRITGQLGEGSFGKVYEIKREDFGITYKSALKAITIPQSESEIQSVLFDGMGENSAKEYFESSVKEIISEFVLMSTMKGSSNIVSYEDHVVIPHEGKIGWDILIRMELLTPLMKYAKNTLMTQLDIIKLGIDMCNALQLCQKRNIIHRDIKPENIFVSKDGHFKLGDFGIARTIEKTTGGLSKKGTYSYMAPEVYKGKVYGSAVDVYSLGMVLYRLINNNRAPFLPQYPEKITHSDRENALIRRMSGEVFPIPTGVNRRLSEIVLKACSYNPTDRYSAPLQMREELEAIRYSQGESAIIYPLGDSVPVMSVDYAESGSSSGDTSGESYPGYETDYDTATEFIPKNGAEQIPAEKDDDATAATEYLPRKGTAPDISEKKKRKPLIFVLMGFAAAVLIAVIILVLMPGRERPVEDQGGEAEGVHTPEPLKVTETDPQPQEPENEISYNIDDDNNDFLDTDEIHAIKVVSAIESSGDSTSFAIFEDGSLWAWGFNGYGQLGDGTFTDRNSSVKIMDDVVSVSAGSRHTMAIKSDGSLWAWGFNGNGELGDGTYTEKDRPVKIMDDVVSVSAGYSHTMAIKSDGSLWGWGYNKNGQLSDGTEENQPYPIEIMDSVYAVIVGYWDTMVIKTDGSLWGWGSNYLINLGDHLTRHDIPAKIMNDVISVYISMDYVFAIKTDNSLWAWGSGSYGVFGYDSEARWYEPVMILEDVIKVSTSGSNTWVIKSDNSLWGWGFNGYNELLDDTYENQLTPIKIMDDVIEVAAGSGYTMILKSDNSLWGWGLNDRGQLGIGETDIHQNKPVQIFPGN